MQQWWGLLEGAQNRKYSKASLELGGSWSPKNAKGVQGQSWKNSKTALEQKTGCPLTLTPEEHMIISHALKHEKAQAHASKPAPFMIPQGITKELTSMMQTWLMNEVACPPAVRQEPDNTLNLLDIDFWLWY